MSASDPNALQVRFALEVEGSEMAEEGSAALAAWPPGRIGLDDLAGQWQLRGGGLTEPVVLDDDLLNLGRELGVNGVRALRAGQPHEMGFEQSEGGVQLLPTAGTTLLLVDGEPLGKLPTAELAEELLACAERLCVTLQALAGDDEGVHAAARALAQEAAMLRLG
jgi:hypothetical protein